MFQRAAPPESERVAELERAMECLFPASEGFTEAFDALIALGLLVEVPADDAFRDEWGDETMYVWRWKAHPNSLDAHEVVARYRARTPEEETP